MKTVLIANRGEIAVRIIRACQELGLRSVAVHSTADANSLHTKIADESICIGAGPSTDSYLSIPKLMSAVEISGADALHPGYGFLAENAELARICEQYGIKFIGPKATHIETLGDKVRARALALKSDVPMLPGSTGVVKDADEIREISKKIGFPMIIKASAGGGGRGMKIVNKASEIEKQFALATHEAETGFGNPDCFVERYCLNPRHVEVQLIGDSFGNFAHLGERDCSIQRRHQKLVEESPCPVFDEKLRAEIGATAVRLGKEAGYESLGTVEFLLDDQGRYYFMEVNTRVQVEHTVTEEVTGIDLVKEQILIAQGAKLSFKTEDIKMNGHAMECRINAEDPESFAPWPGEITAYHEPGGPGVRIDGMVYSGYKVPSLYDSMIAKLITHGRDREECMCRMRRALNEMKVDGIRTNIKFHLRLLDDPQFQKGDVSTHFLDGFMKKK